jgi:hypothetical protein
MHHYATNMWCEQYIKCITTIWHLRKKYLHMGKFDTCYTFPTTFQLQIVYICIFVYFKYMFNLQWGLFCRLGYGVTFFKLLHIKWHELPLHIIFLCYSKSVFVATLLWKSVRMKLTLPKWGLGSPTGLPKFQSSIVGVSTSHWGVLYSIGKLLKCRCRKWARMGHLNICNTSYGKKKGRESN